MSRPTADVHVRSTVPLPTPLDLEAELPVPPAARETVLRGRAAIEGILEGRDQRLLVITGPCSIHDERSALEYAERLAALSEELRDRVCIVMRGYFEKPRTTVGWKGLVYDPDLDGSFDIAGGLRRARKLLIGIAELGLPAATEFLDPILPQYLADLIAWTAIGARTTESQTHRQMASGLSMPVGFKNSTDGNIQIAVDAMVAAREPHAFLGIDGEGRTCTVLTNGNPHGHIVLRGGSAAPNYGAEDVHAVYEQLEAGGLRRQVLIDCSHANSAKDHTRQAIAFRDVLAQRAAGDAGIIGLMLESHLFEGKQSVAGTPGDLRYGVSITDACIGWDETAELLREAAASLPAPAGAPA
jgi:3-deoxy-7-phosphoheptulonate synthase